MSIQELRDWLAEQDGPGVLWGLKRLSANDTQANGSHQAGPYIPKQFLFDLFPALGQRDKLNPRVSFEIAIDSHHDVQTITAIWYNNKFHQVNGTQRRNETRITGFGGASSALLDPESTGALTVFAFWPEGEAEGPRCRVWVARDDVEEDVIEERTGPVEPGQWITYPNLFSMLPRRAACRLSLEDIPPTWLRTFPKGEEIIEKAIGLRPETSADVDQRLMARRECEFEVYRSLEDATYLARIREGFESVDDLLSFSQPISQRRRSRGGRSLELHLRKIFQEEKVPFSWQPVVDGGKRPDFLFPGLAAYQDGEFPAERLRMLAAKSTVRERWTQVLDEASRIERKHLLTLQEGVSENQFNAMQKSGIQLVVPARLHTRYPKAVRPHLQTLESFLGDVRALRR